MAGQAPFEGDDETTVFRNIKDKKAVFPKHFSVEAMDIITSVSVGFQKHMNLMVYIFIPKFLTKKPNNRLGAGRYARQEITTHPFFRNVDWDKAEACEMEPPIKPMIVS